MCQIKAEETYILMAVNKLGALTPAQLIRYLFDSDVCEKFDLKGMLAQLKEKGYLKQAVSNNGITYALTETGESRLACCIETIDAGKRKEVEKIGAELGQLFAIEEDFPVQYTEQANGIVPVFLSIREGQKILLKVSIIVPDVDTAKTVKENWMKNAHKTYEAVWNCIGEGLPFPAFKPY